MSFSLIPPPLLVLLGWGMVFPLVARADEGPLRPLVVLPTPLPAYAGLAFSPEGRVVAACGSGKTIHLWNPKTGTEFDRKRWPGDRNDLGDTFRSLQYAPGGDIVFINDVAHDGVASARSNRLVIATPTSIRFWNPRTDKMTEVVPQGGEENRVHEIVLSPDGKSFAALHVEHGVTLWSTAERKPTRKIDGQGDSYWACRFTPDGKRLVTGNLKGQIQIWDVSDGRLVRTFPGHEYQVVGLDVSRDGRWIGSLGRLGSVKLMEIETGRERTLLPFDRSVPRGGSAARFSPDGRLLATVGSPRGVVRLWNVATGALVAMIETEKSDLASITQVAFSPDGRTFATAGTGSEVKIWPVPELGK